MSAWSWLRNIFRADGWTNVRSRHSSKSQDMRPVRMPELDPETCATLFEEDDFAKRAAKALPEDAMRRGFTFVDEGEDAEPDDANELNEACKRWGIHEKLTEADIWGRVFGGGVIVLGVIGAGLPSEPLDDADIREGSLQFLDVYDRRDIYPQDWYADPMEPKFGQPMTYTLQPTAMTGAMTRVIHETRLIIFGGVLTTKRTKLNNSGWDQSVYSAVFDVLQTSAMNWKSISALMADFAQGVFKIKNLVDILASNEVGVLEDRMRLMDRTRSTERAILLDADEEDFERKATPVAGAADLVDRNWQRVAAAFEMPVTKLMGMSPAGLNATGEKDQDDWDDRVEEHQTKIVKPRAERLGRIIAASEGITAPESLCVQFPPLRTPRPTVEADIRLKWAQMVQILIDKGVVLPEEVALSAFGKGKFSMEITVDLETRRAMLEKELAAAEEHAGEPEPPPVQQLPPAPAQLQLPPKSDGLSAEEVREMIVSSLRGMRQDAPPSMSEVERLERLMNALVLARKAGARIDGDAMLEREKFPVRAERDA